MTAADRPKLPSASEPSAGRDVFLPSVSPDLLSEEVTKGDESSHVDGKVDKITSPNCLPRFKGDVQFEKLSKTVESPKENQMERLKSKGSILRATLSSPALPLYGHSSGPNSNGGQTLGWTSPLRSAASPRTGSGSGWGSLRPAASPGSEQRRSMLASMICDQEEELEERKKEGKEKQDNKGKEDVRMITEEKAGKANAEDRKDTQLTLGRVDEQGTSLRILSSSSETETSNSAAEPTPRPAFAARAFLTSPSSTLTSTSSTSTTPTSFKQSTQSTIIGCPMFKSSPSAEEGEKDCSISPNIVSEVTLRSSKEKIVPASKNDSRGTSPSAPRQSRSIAELSEALKLSLATPSSSSKPAGSLKSRRYSAPPTNYSNLPSSSPLSSPQTARSSSLLKPSGHHLSKSMQQFCLKASPVSASATTEEHQQPSSLGSSTSKACSLQQQQPSSLQMLRKQDDQPSSKFSSKNTFTLKPPSLQPSSRFVSKTTISLGQGEVAPSPPILYSPNNSVTCGVRPNSGGVRVAIGSSSDSVGSVAGGGGGSAGGPRLGPRPWASCKGEVRLVENTAAGVSTIKISPPSPPSSTHSNSTTAARVNIGSFGQSANKEDLPLLSLPSLQSETKEEALGFSF